uniref:Inner mitochondrial membrane peptidase subunit 2 n=1 Tax=Sparus aurata TaxID=8175 RepID=A0A671TZ96_SPAAU
GEGEARARAERSKGEARAGRGVTLGYKNRYVRVPDGHFWIEGDHHGHSLDSNSFGPVSVGLLHGRASHIIWPPHRWQQIKPSLPANRGPLDTQEEEG